MSEYLTDLGIKDYKLIQDTDDYAFSQDSVFLANMAKLSSRDGVLTSRSRRATKWPSSAAIHAP